MRHKILLIAIWLFLTNSIRAQNTGLNSGNISGIISEHQLGAWGMLQHNNISSAIFQAVSEGKVHALNMDDNEMRLNFHGIASYLDPNVIIEGSKNGVYSREFGKVYDTFPVYDDYFKFELTVLGGLSVQTMITNKTVEFNANIFKLLSEEQKFYLELFQVNNQIFYSQLPITSEKIMYRFNTELYFEYLLPETLVYGNDSLTQVIPQKSRSEKSQLEVLTFVLIMPDDPTIGYDSISLIPFLDVMQDSTKLKSIGFVICIQNGELIIKGIGCGFQLYANETTKRSEVWRCIGYQDFQKSRALTSSEKQAFNSFIFFILKENLNQKNIHTRNYIDEFHLKA